MRRWFLLAVFLLLPLRLDAQLQLVNNSQAFGWNYSTNMQSVTVSNQLNSQPFNTTGADLIIVTVASDPVSGGLTVRDYLGGVLTSNVWHALFPHNTVGSNGNVYYTRPLQTGANHSFQVFGTNAAQNCYCAAGVLALTGWDGQAPTISARRVDGNFPNTAVTLLGPLTNTTPNQDLALFTFGTFCSAFVSLGNGAGFSQIGGDTGCTTANTGYSFRMAWRIGTNAMEHLVFNVTIPSFQMNITGVIFHAGQAPPPGGNVNGLLGGGIL